MQKFVQVKVAQLLCEVKKYQDEILKMMIQQLQYKTEWDSALTSGLGFTWFNEGTDSTDLNRSPWTPFAVNKSLISRVNGV